MINTKMVGMLVAAFVAGSFVASPELRAYAANTVFSTDIVDGEVKTADLANGVVTSAKIKDGEVKTNDIAASAVGSARIKDNDVKAQDIATDAVGADELQGVTKLLFVSCPITITNFAAGNVGSFSCSVPAVQAGDHVVTTLDASTTEPGRHCMVPTSSFAGSGIVTVRYRNECSTAVTTSFSAEMIIFKN